ncbi:B-cell receptor CD22-like isoform X2 [Clupea harengus]|uniref:B-cell receptor CD22-like isoform X2 n=1 Tax=Clupea harengus TaxID=7950 RepID=A0A6P8EQB6_CLUHA|nr:B-cell receptor CD22-like isoform X2 [Clupea harengus]
MTEGSTVTLTCMSEADPPVQTYTWIKKSGAVELKSGKEKTLIFSKIRSEDRGEYICQAANRIGQQDSPVVSVKVLYPPKNTRIESDASGEMIEGSTVTLTCMSEADPPVHTYTWIKKSGAVELKSGKEKTLIFSKIRSEDRGEYLCQAANRIGQQDSPAVSVQVSYRPKKTTVSFSHDSVIAMGNTVTLTCSSDANPPVEIYTWFKVGESTPVGSGQQYSITNISSEDGGQYYCEARNKHGAEDSTAVSIMEDESVAGAKIPVLTAVITVSVCGLLGLFCGVFWLSKKCKKEMLAQGRNEQVRQRTCGQCPSVYCP